MEPKLSNSKSGNACSDPVKMVNAGIDEFLKSAVFFDDKPDFHLVGQDHHCL